MKILYAIQGTGNGHISRARAIIPELCRHGEVEVLVSGTQAEVALDYPVKYRLKGLGFIFGKSGGIDLMATYRKNKIRRFKKEVAELPVAAYDVVISDFEPVSAWACMQKGKACIGLSHQAAVLNAHAPQPAKKDRVGTAFLKYYAPASRYYGFHFQAYDDGIFTPVIRDGVRRRMPAEEGHYTVYLPAYSDQKIVAVLSQFPEVQWDVFSKHARDFRQHENIVIRPIHDNSFLHSMAQSKGVLCGAGFEAPAEALFLKKKLLVIPMKGQYEQHCNAAALQDMGVRVIRKLGDTAAVAAWLEDDRLIAVDYPDNTAAIIDRVMTDHEADMQQSLQAEMPHAEKFKRSMLQKMVAAYLGK